MPRKDPDPFAADPFAADPWADGGDPFQEADTKRSPRRRAAPPGIEMDGESLDTPAFDAAPPGARSGTAGARAALVIAASVAVLLVVGGVVAALALRGGSSSSDEGSMPPPTAVAPAQAIGDSPAAPGTTIPAGGGALEVGPDAAPGVYVAEGAVTGQCWWSLEGQIDGVGAPTFLYGEATGTDPLVVLSEGFTFTPTGCPAWVAVDPETAFVGGEDERFAGTVSVVGGRDIVPGTYLSTGTPDPSVCFARAVDAYASLGGGVGTYAVTTPGGTTVLEVKRGDLVSSAGCADFARAEMAAVVARDGGQESFAGQGEFIVGVDVRSGTYGAAGADASCSLTVYPDYRLWYATDVAPVAYYGTSEVAGVTLEPGQGISVWGCPNFTRRD